MKTIIISTLPSGFGHRKITIRYRNGKEYSAVTSNMSIFDEYKSDVFTRNDIANQKRAEKSLINYVKERNNLH